MKANVAIITSIALVIPLFASPGQAAAPSQTAAARDAGKSPKHADESPAALALNHEQRGEFALAASILRTAYELSQRPHYLLLAAQDEQRAVKLDAAEQGFNELLRRDDALRDDRAAARQHLLEIVVMRQALAKARIDARRHAAAAARRFDIWQFARLTRHKPAKDTKEPGPGSAATARKFRKHGSDAWRKRAGLLALTLSGVVLIGKSLLAERSASQSAANEGASSEAAETHNKLLLLTGGIVAGVGTALLLSQPADKQETAN